MTTNDTVKHLPLPWNGAAHYWLCIVPGEALDGQGQAALTQLGFENSGHSPQTWCLKAPSRWGASFEAARAVLGHSASAARVSVIADGDAPDANNITYQLRPFAEVARLSTSLWLGDALREGRIHSYMQPIIDKRGKIFGHEALVRASGEDGTIIGGGKVIAASKDLNIEHMLDRYLHVHAVRTFIESDLEGFLFINFTPGFIHRPSVYLEGLTETVVRYGLPPKHVVLDFTQAETPRDPQHLKAIFDYCREKGYSTSMDDIASTDRAAKLIGEVRPDFIKLDMSLTRKALEPGGEKIIGELMDVAHRGGCTVIAEGVETEEIHNALRRANVDLFQGWLFSPAVASSPSKAAKTQH